MADQYKIQGTVSAVEPTDKGGLKVTVQTGPEKSRNVRFGSNWQGKRPATGDAGVFFCEQYQVPGTAIKLNMVQDWNYDGSRVEQAVRNGVEAASPPPSTPSGMRASNPFKDALIVAQTALKVAVAAGGPGVEPFLELPVGARVKLLAALAYDVANELVRPPEPEKTAEQIVSEAFE